MLPLYRLESRRHRKPLRKIGFHSLILSSRPYALVNTLERTEGLFLTIGRGHKMSPPAAFFRYTQSQRYQRELLPINSRMNLAHRSRAALPSMYSARAIAATFCQIWGSTRNSFPVLRRFNLAESRRHRKKVNH